MRNFSICGERVASLKGPHDWIEAVDMDGLTVHCGLMHAGPTPFEPESPEHRELVLVRVKAFSCNFRDKGWVVKMARHGRDDGCYVIGSDFVGEVVELGADATGLAVGDRVIPQSSYPWAGVEGVPPGLPTNHASLEVQPFHPAKLIQIPPEMPDEVAAGFTIGAQTGYSMIRRMDLRGGEDILVTAPRSNTSLFVINALRNRDVRLVALARSLDMAERLRALGVSQVIAIDPAAESYRTQDDMAALVKETHGFDCVIDPIYDVHMPHILDLLAFGGRYISCGKMDQVPGYLPPGVERDERDLDRVMRYAMLKNLSIMGNCLGTREDLEQALADYSAGGFSVEIDSVHTGHQVGSFVTRTFVDRDRFGKVIYRYEDLA